MPLASGPIALLRRWRISRDTAGKFRRQVARLRVAVLCSWELCLDRTSCRRHRTSQQRDRRRRSDQEFGGWTSRSHRTCDLRRDGETNSRIHNSRRNRVGFTLELFPFRISALAHLDRLTSSTPACVPPTEEVRHARFGPQLICLDEHGRSRFLATEQAVEFGTTAEPVRCHWRFRKAKKATMRSAHAEADAASSSSHFRSSVSGSNPHTCGLCGPTRPGQVLVRYRTYEACGKSAWSPQWAGRSMWTIPRGY